jgi:chromosome segregation ATPase
LSGERRPVLFHGVPLGAHPDGVRSMAVTARSMAEQRQLEATLVRLETQLREREADVARTVARLEEADDLRRQIGELKVDLDARDAALASAESARRAAEKERAQALTDVRQLELALEMFASRKRETSAARGQGERA